MPTTAICVDDDVVDPRLAAPPADIRVAMSVTDAAEALGVGRTKMYELLDSGALESIRIGARRLVTRRALLAFVAGLEGGAPVASNGSDE